MKIHSFYPVRILSALALACALLTSSTMPQSSAPAAPTDVDAADKTAGFAAMGNPAAVHCRDMGYEYGIVHDGGQRGICTLPDGEVCDAWAFLQGQCAQGYSYCVRQGYQVRTVGDGKNPFSPEYAVCVTGQGIIIGSVTELSGLGEKATGCGGDTAGGETPVTLELGGEYVASPDAAPPASFDWRNYLGSDWLTPVKSQGGCGSCWAFSAVGVAEAAHNIASNDPNLDKNLSEQYLVSDCSSSGTCCGGAKASALRYIRDSGIPDESCMPYVDGSGCSCGAVACDSNCAYNTGGSCSDRTCSDRCGDWAIRREYIASTGYVSTDRQVIKQALVDTGPLAVSMGILSSYGGYWDGDIYRCTIDIGTNHAVVIVGYDDAGGYWWVRNSWGTGWGDNGYFKLGYGECSVEQYVYYALAGSSGGDSYEPDDTSSQAQWIYSGSPQTHTIVPAGDVDWVKFSLGAESEVVIETSGPYGDTRMWLYDSSTNQLEYNDDGGSGLFSRIDRVCGTDALPAGTYYVKIDEYGNDDEIPSYDIAFTVVQTCPAAGPLRYNSHLVDDDSGGNSIGNGDGVVDCGETIELYADLYNQGTDTAAGVQATISTSDLHVTWLSNTSSSYPNIAGSATGTNNDDYDFEVDPTTPNGHLIEFGLDISAANGGPWSDSFEVAVTCTPNNPPNVPSNPSPSEGAAGVPTTANLSWNGGDPDPGDTVTYDVYMGNTNPPVTLRCSGVSGTTCNPGVLSPVTHYYWYVAATDGHGASTEGDTWDFTTTVDGDSYEPDNASGQASWIYSGSPQTHSIVPTGDADWLKFSLFARSEIVMETSGPSGDTRMWLYDSDLNELESNDDGGSGSFSRIDRLCGVDALPAGTYLARVEEHGNNDEIPSYYLTLTVPETCGEGSLIYLPVLRRAYP